MRTIDLNCDMGEGCPNDAQLMKYISSANIACGYHAGDADTMRRTVELAMEHSVAIGAHPGYRDAANFGRTPLSLSREEVFALVTEQIVALKQICDQLGAVLHHVKPHGALYNQAAKDKGLANAIARAVAEFDRDLIFYGLSNSFLISEAEDANLRTASEVFADRTYRTDGGLTPRSEPGAVITDSYRSLAQVMQMVQTSTVATRDGEIIPIDADTICVHGDGESAVEFAQAIRRELDAQGINVQAPY
jgi:UPF0271 protein